MPHAEGEGRRPTRARGHPALSVLAASALAAGIGACPTPATAQALAVTYFANHSEDLRFDPLGRGLAEMLITDLSQLSDIQIVERTRLHEVLGELELARSDFIDPRTAAAVGRGVGAAYVLTGALTVLESEMRIDARIVDVASAEVVRADEVTGRREEFFLLEKELAAKIADGLEVRISAPEMARLGRVSTESFDAFLAWSRGLDALDRGALEEARDALSAALDHDDRFALAEGELEALDGRLRELGLRSAEAAGEVARAMLRQVETFSEAGGSAERLAGELAEFSTRASLPAAARDIKAVAARVLELELPESATSYGPMGTSSVNEWALLSFVQASYYLGDRADFLVWGEAYLERYPVSTWSASVQRQMEEVAGGLRRTEEGRSRIPEARARARSAALGLACGQERRPRLRLEACRSWIEEANEVGIALDESAESRWADAAWHAGDLAEVERALEAAVARTPDALQVEAIRTSLARWRSADADAERALAGLPGAETPAEAARAVRAAFGAGREEAARRALEDAFGRWPDSDELYGAGIELACHVHDLVTAGRLLERWEAAEAAGRGTVRAEHVRLVASTAGAADLVREVEALELRDLAMELARIHQHEAAGGAWLELARRFPANRWHDGPLSLHAAANAYRTAFLPDPQRAALEEFLDRYGEHELRSVVEAQLATLPR